MKCLDFWNKKKNVLVVKRYLGDKDLLFIIVYLNDIKYKFRMVILSDKM